MRYRVRRPVSYFFWPCPLGPTGGKRPDCRRELCPLWRRLHHSLDAILNRSPPSIQHSVPGERDGVLPTLRSQSVQRQIYSTGPKRNKLFASYQRSLNDQGHDAVYVRLIDLVKYVGHQPKTVEGCTWGNADEEWHTNCAGKGEYMGTNGHFLIMLHS